MDQPLKTPHTPRTLTLTQPFASLTDRQQLISSSKGTYESTDWLLIDWLIDWLAGHSHWLGKANGSEDATKYTNTGCSFCFFFVYIAPLPVSASLGVRSREALKDLGPHLSNWAQNKFWMCV